SKMAVVNTIKSCTFDNDTQSATVLTNANLSRRCIVPAAATVTEVDVWADAGTPSVQIEKNHAGTKTNLLSGALSAGTDASPVCASTNATCYAGQAKSGTVTVSTTALAAGDIVDIASGTAGGTATRCTVQVFYTIN